MSTIQKAIALNPQHSSTFEGILGRVYFGLDRFEEAERAYVAVVAANPEWPTFRAGLAAILAAQGKLEEAKRQIDELLKLSPSFSIAGIPVSMPYKEDKDRDRYINALCAAGLPEE